MEKNSVMWIIVLNNICREKGYYWGGAFSDNWFFLWLVGALVCTNYHYQVSRALGLIICSPEYKMLVQNGQKRHFQPTPNIFFAHIFLDYLLLTVGAVLNAAAVINMEKHFWGWWGHQLGHFRAHIWFYLVIRASAIFEVRFLIGWGC